MVLVEGRHSAFLHKEPFVRFWCVVVGLVILSVGLWRSVARWRANARISANAEVSINDYIEASVGDSLCRPGGGPWARAGQGAFVIVTSATCGACTSSKEFDEKLYDYGITHAMPVVYILADRQEHDERARELKSSGRTVLRTRLTSLGVMRLPTFLRIRSSGVIESKWTGIVPPGRQESIFESITVGTSKEQYQRMSGADALRFVEEHPEAQRLALSDHVTDLRGGLMVIPDNELSVRARYELNPTLPVVVYCGTGTPRSCQQAAILLAELQFRVAAVNLPPYHSHCGS
jgi:hypothetical protein